MDVFYAPSFVRMYKTLHPLLKIEAKEKIERFRNRKNHEALGVHKLKGALRDQYSFRVDYRTRVVYYVPPKSDTAILLAIGDHDVYDR